MHCPPYSNVPANFYSYNNNRFALDFTSTYLYIKGVIKIQVNLTMKKNLIYQINIFLIIQDLLFLLLINTIRKILLI